MQTGHNYTLEVEFRASRAASKVYLKLYALIGKKSIKLPLFAKRDLCQLGDEQLQCPIKPPGNYTYRLPVRIPKLTPNLVAALKLQLLNQNRHKFLCFQFPFIIQS